MVFGTLKTQYASACTDLTVREAAVFSALLLPMLVLGLASAPVLTFVQWI